MATIQNVKVDEETKKEAKKRQSKGNFNEEIKKMLYAFGDDENPRTSVIECLEEFLLDFLDKLLTKCSKRMSRRDQSSNKLIKEDVLYQIKEDPKWMARLADIVQKKNEISKLNKDADPADPGDPDKKPTFITI